MIPLKCHRLFIDGEWLESGRTHLTSPFSGESVGEVSQADQVQIERGVVAASKAFPPFKKTSRFIRARLLSLIAAGIEARRADLRTRMIQEAGKPFSLADVEVSRAVGTFTLAAEEAKRFGGSVIPLDYDVGSRAYAPAVVSQVPRGPLLAITPFNFPLNLIAHKVAPALAVGCPVIVKPPPQAPGCAGILAEIFEEAHSSLHGFGENIPKAVFQVLHASNELLTAVLSDPRIPMLSFTGSSEVGWMLKSRAIRKRVFLELGGNAAVIVHKDADLKRAAARCAFGGYAYSGQICISVQRIFVQREALEEFQKLFVAEISKLKVGDPHSSDTIVGPLIDRKAVERISDWIGQAEAAGASRVVGGEVEKNFIAPALLVRVPVTSKLSSEEVFGPVVILEPYDQFEQALNMVNQSRFGLQAGVFTSSLKLSDQASEELDVGGVVLNDIPTFRADNMPYGGMKESGEGREGVLYAMEEYCEKKVVVKWRG